MVYLIRGGMVVAGSSADDQPVQADVAIEGDCICKVGKLAGFRADVTIDAEGLVVAPGFIDCHAHSEFALLADGRAAGKIAQGVTTEINGNCGMSAAPLIGPALEQRDEELRNLGISERWQSFEEYFSLLQRAMCAVNVATLVGHGNLRASVAGYADRPLSSNEMTEIVKLLKEALKAGARGLSTGLIYPPGIYSGTEEISALAKETAAFDGVYATHMRSEGDQLLESVQEVISIAEFAGIRAHISHLKTSGRQNWEKIDGLLTMLHAAQKRGTPLTCDRYPYTASSTDLDAMLPAWAFEGGRQQEMEVLNRERNRLADYMVEQYSDADWENVVVASTQTGKNRGAEGMSVAALAQQQQKKPWECLIDLLIEENLSVGAIFFVMNEENLTTILREPYIAIGSDSTARSFDGITAAGVPHPRGFGTFPRVLGRFVREEGVLSLGEALYKMTGLPASVFRLRGRGTIREGYFADVTVFSADTVSDRASYDKPFQRPGGIHHVFVNGVPVVSDGTLTDARPGRILR